MTPIQIVIATVFCISLGAFFGCLAERWRKAPPSPDSTKHLCDALKNVQTWIQEGTINGFLDTDACRDAGKHEVMLDWLQRTPYTMMKHTETLQANERNRLQTQFKYVCAFLLATGVLAAVLGMISWKRGWPPGIYCACAGFFGGVIAALRSCLDRHANGFEDQYGNVSPDPWKTKERFGDGIKWWFYGRPFLSAGVGLLVYFALKGEVFPKEVNEKISQGLVFYACLAGLLAKTMLDLFFEFGKKSF